MQLAITTPQTPASRYVNDTTYAGVYARDAVTVIEGGASDFPDPQGWGEAVDEAISSAAGHARNAVELLDQLPERPANADDVIRAAALLEDAGTAWAAVDLDAPHAYPVVELLETAAALFG